MKPETPNSDAPRAALIDDNLMFGMMVEPGLKRLGYQVRSSAGGPGTVAALEAFAPELVVINLTSQRYSGPGLVRELRASPALAGVPILGYAGHKEKHFFGEGQEAGCTLVAPNSAMRKVLPEVLEKLHRLVAGQPTEAWPDED